MSLKFETIEQKFLQEGLNAIQRETQVKPIRGVPDWTITSFEVDIDPFHDLGKGHFGVVKKGLWNQTPVAIKLVEENTSEKVLNLHQRKLQILTMIITSY